MSADDPLRRQLRFALFRQIAGAVMFGIAFATRAIALGVDVVTAILGLVTLLIVIAAIVTRKKMQDLAP